MSLNRQLPKDLQSSEQWKNASSCMKKCSKLSTTTYISSHCCTNHISWV